MKNEKRVNRIKYFCIDFCIISIIFLLIINLLIPRYVKKIRKDFEIHEILVGKEYEIISKKNILDSDRNVSMLITDYAAKSFENEFDIELPQNDFDENFFVISYGYPIKFLYYQEINKQEWSINEPHAEAVLSNTFHKNTIYVYQISSECGVRAFLF